MKPTSCRRYRASAASLRANRSSPSKSTRPPEGRSSAPSTCSSVDLPTPEAPTSATTSRCPTVIDAPRNTRTISGPVRNSRSSSSPMRSAVGAPAPGSGARRSGKRARSVIHVGRQRGCAGLRRPTFWLAASYSSSCWPSGRLRRAPPPDVLACGELFIFLLAVVAAAQGSAARRSGKRARLLISEDVHRVERAGASGGNDRGEEGQSHCHGDDHQEVGDGQSHRQVVDLVDIPGEP